MGSLMVVARIFLVGRGIEAAWERSSLVAVVGWARIAPQMIAGVGY